MTGAQLYEMLRPKFPCVFDIMLQIPNVNAQDLQKFDEKVQANLANHKIGNKVDKSTRDLFRKITNSVSDVILFLGCFINFGFVVLQLIGRNISQLFKKEVKIIDLPQLNPKKTKKDRDMQVSFKTDLTVIFPND